MKNILIGILGVLILVGGIAPGNGLAQTYTVSGYVRTSEGLAISGVTMTGLPDNPATNDAGYYSATVPSGWAGIVKPQKTGYAIFPFSTEYIGIMGNQTLNCTAVLLPKVALAVNPTTYNLGDSINITMTLENQGAFSAPQGFTATNFALFLQFFDPDQKLITSNFGIGGTPLPPAVVSVITPDNKVELLSVDYVESVSPNWQLLIPFNALDYYTLSKGGNYSAKAKFSMRAYLETFETAPGSGVFYALHDSGSSGDVESNIISFSLMSSLMVDHITINPTSSTITAGSSQTYTALGFDANNNSADMTGATKFSIAPDGSCDNRTHACTATAVGPHTVTGDAGGKIATASLQVITGGANAGVSTVGANPSSVVADGSTTSTITVTLKDSNSNPVSGRTVLLTAGGGSSTITPASATTNSGGQATFTVKDTVAQSVTYTANDTTDNITISATATVTFTALGVSASNSTVVANPTSVVADGSTTSTITVMLKDANSNRVSGKAVSLTAGRGSSTITPLIGTTNSSGQVTFTVKDTVVESVTYTAKDTTDNITINATATVNFTYPFTGFLSPIQNSPKWNTANGGVTIALKWRITNAKGVGISNRNSFMNLKTYNKLNDCTSTNIPSNPTNTETSGLQYNGDGYWQYNWKSPKTPTPGCWIITINLSDGTAHQANFKLTK